MLIAVLRRHILRIAVDSGRPVAPDIVGAGRRGQLAGVQADGDGLELRAAVKGLGGLPLVDRLHDHFPQPGGRVAVVAGQIDLLRLVVAAPYGGGVVARKAAEPPVPVAGGCAGLSGDGLSREDGRSAGAGVGRVVQAVVHIFHSLLAEDLPGILGVVQDQLALAVVDLGVKPGLPVDTVVGKGPIGRGHFPYGGAHGQRSQGQGGHRHIGKALAVGQGIAVRQGVLAEVVLGEAVAVAGADGIQGVGGNGVDGGHNAAENRPAVVVFPAVVSWEGHVIDILQRHILDHRSRAEAPLFKGGGVDGDGLLGRAGLELGLGGLVVGEEIRLLSHAAGQGYHIAGAVVDDHNAGLELLGAAGGGDLLQIRVDGIHLILHIHIQGGINMVAALLDPLQVVVPGLFSGGLPIHTVLGGQVPGHIQNGRIHKPAVHCLRGVQIHGHQAAALRAVVVGTLLLEGRHSAAVAAVVAVRPAVLGVDPILKDHLLGHCRVVFLLGQIPLVQHLGQDIQLPVPVPTGTVPDLSLIFKGIVRVGIEQRGVVGNADEAGALRRGQVLELLAEVGGGSALDAVAALAQIDPVQVLVHDDVFVVLLLEHLGPENFHHLSLDGDAVFLAHVFDQLLGDGGAAELGVPAEEHIHAGLHGGDPVHALVLVEPLVLNGDGGIDQILRDLLQRGDLPVRGGINLLELLNISVVVHIIKEGGLFQIVVVNGPVGGFRQDIVLEIVSQSAHKDHAADEQDQHHRQAAANGDLQGGEGRGAQRIQSLDRPVGIPILAFSLLSPSFHVFILCHRSNPRFSPVGAKSNPFREMRMVRHHIISGLYHRNSKNERPNS